MMDVNYLIGKTESEANDYLETLGLKMRVVKRDGNPFFVVQEVGNTTTIDVAVKNGRVERLI